MADVLALTKARDLRLNTKIGPVFTINTKEAALDRLHKGDPLCRFLVLAVNTGHTLVLRRKTCAFVASQGIPLSVISYTDSCSE